MINTRTPTEPEGTDQNAVFDTGKNYKVKNIGSQTQEQQISINKPTPFHIETSASILQSDTPPKWTPCTERRRGKLENLFPNPKEKPPDVNTNQPQTCAERKTDRNRPTGLSQLKRQHQM